MNEEVDGDEDYSRDDVSYCHCCKDDVDAVKVPVVEVVLVNDAEGDYVLLCRVVADPYYLDSMRSTRLLPVTTVPRMIGYIQNYRRSCASDYRRGDRPHPSMIGTY